MIKVYVIDMGRKYLYFQWLDPKTGLKVTRSSRLTRRRDAERAAGELEEQLNKSRRPGDGSIDWDDFLALYGAEHLSGLAHNTVINATAIFNRFEQSQRPGHLRDLNTAALSAHAASLRKEGRSEDTILKHLRHLGGALRWAHDNNLIAEMPAIPKIHRASNREKLMRGRPLTADEFSAVVKSAAEMEPSLADIITGLWLSGLRLNESLKLTWDDSAKLMIDLTDAARPKLLIPRQHDKGHQSRVHPLTPDFAEFLLSRKERTGHVFNVLNEKGRVTRSPHTVGHAISEAGRRSGVKVGDRWPTAHDLRRSFGSRWSLLVPAFVLKELMRHASLSTTEKYYVGQSATRTQDEVYKAWERMTEFANKIANS